MNFSIILVGWNYFVVLLLITSSESRPAPDPALPPVMGFPISIVKDVRSPPQKDGIYSYEIVLTDGTMIKQDSKLGEMPNNSSPDFQPFLIISGEYSYTDPKGKLHHVTYTADKNGYRPIIDGSVVGGTVSVSTPGPTLIIPQSSRSENAQPEKPLETISASLFSAPSRFF
ncbi:cuticle protein CP14.6 [Folsomia candida]|uniref:cuticle protein CP14.6 n=1 Tax=Folsomia candida TaxID=158441 RepID=UPI000B8FFF0F|nr:cuticle protein CP14.6 [Folsomia candida]